MKRIEAYLVRGLQRVVAVTFHGSSLCGQAIQASPYRVSARSLAPVAQEASTPR
jgi:hypothetical protein